MDETKIPLQENPAANATVYSSDEDTIDLMAIAKTLWNGRKTILFSVLACAVIGVFVALVTPEEYTVSTVMVPQVGSSSKASSLSSLASLAGFDLSSMSQGSSELSPLIYPKIINSLPFKLELMNTPVHFEDSDSTMTLYEYYTNKKKKTSFLGSIRTYTIGLPAVIMGAIRKPEKEKANLPGDLKNKPLQLTKQQDKVKKQLDQMILLGVEKKEGYLTLTVNMPEALVAAEVAQKAQQLLQEYITQFKIEKSKAELDFIQERYNVSKAEAEGYQYNVASSSDRYKDLTSNVPQVSNARLQTKYSIANTVYLELAKQLEQAKIQVKKDTPVFTIVEPISIPTERSKPSRAKIVVIWLFFGGLIGCSIVYGKQWARSMIEKWQSA